jgi:hypothetical protein
MGPDRDLVGEGGRRIAAVSRTRSRLRTPRTARLGAERRHGARVQIDYPSEPVLRDRRPVAPQRPLAFTTPTSRRTTRRPASRSISCQRSQSPLP